MTTFKDNFSKQSDIYVKYRPHYPVRLYQYLSSLTKKHELAWDCGTGNGQAATGLTAFYKNIIATDPSEEQIKNAIPNKKITYVVETAEQTSIQSKSVDLLTIANALHWFNFDLFYKEVHRVVKKNGIIAAWCYGVPNISPEIDQLIHHLHDAILGIYWQDENRLVEKEYTTTPFPFEEMTTPQFFCEKIMTLNDFMGFLNTWSATQRFIAENKFNPTEELFDKLESLWGGSHSEKKLCWKIILKVGRV